MFKSDSRQKKLKSVNESGRVLALVYRNSTTLSEGIFRNLSRLNSLQLERNKLSTLPAGHQTELSCLEVDGNKLMALPENLLNNVTDEFPKNQEYLRWLKLNGNRLTTLQENIFNRLANLTSLILHADELVTSHENIFTFQFGRIGTQC